jgi:SP family galactose:H+ symporter-like MFS transporter
MTLPKPAKTFSKTFLYQISGIAALSGLLFGYDTGVISGAILFVRRDFGLTDTLTETVVSAVLVGALIGAAVGGKVADSFGRKKVMIASALIFIAGSLASALAPTPYALIASRIVLGIAIGISSFAAPLYLAEIAPPEARGKLVSLNQLAITFGILTSYIADYLLASGERWRWMLGIGIIPALTFLVGLIFLPESPRWLLVKGGHEAQARKILLALRGSKDVEKEINEIHKSLHQKETDWKFFEQGWVRTLVFICIGLSIFQQTTGINTIIYYAPTILQMAGFQEAQGAILATLGLGIVNVLATLVALPLIDRWGRRPLLLGGLVGMSIALVITGLSFSSHPEGAIIGTLAGQISGGTHVLAVVGMILYIISFAMSLGPLCWLLISEIIPLKIRGVGSSLATSVNWTSNIVVAMTFLTLIRHIGPSGTFYLYAGTCVLAWIFVWRFVPETKGRTLEQIELEFKQSHR